MLQLFLFFTVLVAVSALQPGPVVLATKGEIWPQPQQQDKFAQFLIVSPSSFSFRPPEDINCPNFLNDALKRYWMLVTKSGTLGSKSTSVQLRDENFVGYLDTLDIILEEECPGEDVLPAFGDDESYNIQISATNSYISSHSVWGLLRGLESFSQMIYKVEDSLWINVTNVTDYPRFSHRGLLLDTSRHYMPVAIILETLDAMSYNKLNVFHWHITDDHSFPYQSKTFPELSNRGAFHPVTKIYDQIDVHNIIEYARLRGIRVIPEFDTPGHTASWGAAYPELLTNCYGLAGLLATLGPMNPTSDNTYDFIAKLLEEIVEVFPDDYFHVGGDEVDFGCWQSNPQITDFMKTNNITDYAQLENHFIQRVLDILDNLDKKYLVWEEVFVNGASLPSSTVVHVWRFDGFGILNAVTKAGNLGLFSSCWYLDQLANGGDWKKFYECEPFSALETEQQKELVIGGEACMWAEAVNEYNVVSRIWPRASAAAERLWSAEGVNDAGAAEARLEEHTCRMNARGIGAQPPNGPGVCL